MRRTLRLLFAGAFGLVAACQDAAEPTGPQDEPLQAVDGTAGSLVAGQYIVVFRDDVADAPGLARQLARAHGSAPIHTYQHAIKGFAAQLPAQAVEGLRRNPNVAYVEQDQIMRKVTTQEGATWGLDRIDQTSLPLSTTYTYTSTGAGVRAYILDTGIHLAHTDFTGRVTSGPDFIENDSNANDCDGHGTHVAGTVGGTTWGVAKQVDLVAVRVLDCNGSGTTAGVIAGIEWVTANHVKPAVANMSLGGGASTALDQAVEQSIAAGVFYAVSAGNGNRGGRPLDACGQSPARTPSAVTVGATSQTDTEASFSNYGSCVDILAPGVSIRSAYNNHDGGSATASGTSMSSPHVAGAAALYLDANSGATPVQVATALTTNAVQNAITLHNFSASGGTPNLLLYTGFIGGGGDPPTNQTPTASYTYSCDELACSFDGTGSSDSDGTITSYSWNFGDGNTETGPSPSHTFGSADTYSVSLTVTDDDGGTDVATQNVTVSTAGDGGVMLQASGYKVKGVQHAELTWSGTGTAAVDVYRGGSPIATNTSDNPYVDNIGAKGGGSYQYHVCEAGSSTCSSTVTVTF